MRLSTFEVATELGPKQRVGVMVDNETVVDVTAGYAELLAESGDPTPEKTAETSVPPDMRAFLERGERAMDAAREVRSAADRLPGEGASGRRVRFDREEVTLLASVPRPNSIRAFSVFEEHLRATFPHELPEVWYEMPIYWKGNPDAVVGPREDVRFPAYAERMDFEIEVAAVVGKRGENLDPEEVPEHLAGYTIHNDWSERAIQMTEMEMSLGPAMGKDFANGFGPYLVTPDEFDVEGASYSVCVNDEVWTERTLGDPQHSIPEAIAHLTEAQPVLPGDVVVTGTLPGGCGLEHDRQLRAGDVVELSIDGLGTLRNRVEKRTATAE